MTHTVYLYSEVQLELLREIPAFTNIQSGQVIVLLTNVIMFCLLSFCLSD